MGPAMRSSVMGAKTSGGFRKLVQSSNARQVWEVFSSALGIGDEVDEEAQYFVSEVVVQAGMPSVVKPKQAQVLAHVQLHDPGWKPRCFWSRRARRATFFFGVSPRAAILQISFCLLYKTLIIRTIYRFLL